MLEIAPTPDQAVESDFERFLYARGYLLTSFPATPPKPDWRSVSFCGLHLAYDPANRFASATAKPPWRVGPAASVTVAILGSVLDTDIWSDDADRLARNAAVALLRSETALLEMVDAWAGRFLLIFESRGKVRILTDACAMRSAYYSFSRGFVIASHVRLAAKAVGAGPSELMRQAHKDPRWQFGEGRFPGHATPFEEVWVLTPNTLIEVAEERVRRFFPREPLAEISAEDAAEAVAPILRRTVSEICAHNSVAVSLTGGLDSRVTLAAARERASEVEFFTYVHPRQEQHRADGALAREMAGALGLRHRLLDLGGEKGPAWEAFKRALTRSVHTKHLPDAAFAYYKAFAGTDVHLRSNLGEIGRRYYRKHRVIVNKNMSARTMADIFKPKPMSDNPSVLALFRRYYETVEFRGIRNYDPYDMLYWEHRMSSWHTPIVLQADSAFETLIVFNNRRVLVPLLGVPLPDRRTSKAFKRTIELLWPELLRWEFV